MITDHARVARSASPGFLSRILVGVDDDLLPWLPSDLRLWRISRDFASRFTSASRLLGASGAPAQRVADPARLRSVFVADAQVFAQDELALMYLDGALLWPTGLVAYGDPERGHGFVLREGASAALLFMTYEPSGWRLRIGVTAPVERIYSRPQLSWTVRVDDRWLRTARTLLEARRRRDASKSEGRAA